VIFTAVPGSASHHRDVIALYEVVASGAGCLPAARVAGIALNTAHLEEEAAQMAWSEETRQETGFAGGGCPADRRKELLAAVMGWILLKNPTALVPPRHPARRLEGPGNREGKSLEPGFNPPQREGLD